MDLLVLRVAYVGLVFYNLFFFLGKYLPTISWIQPVYKSIDKYIVYFEILELLGVMSIFVDLITNYDSKTLFARRSSLTLCALLFMAFALKIFIIWFHASMIVN